jgi:hypothetical protein
MAKKVADEANRQNRTIAFISYAFSVPGQKATKEFEGYFLYVYKPLQMKKA